MKNVKKVVKGCKVEPKVKMLEYSIKMVIPTGDYANIQPEIKVTAGTLEEAHDYIAPHMNKLWKEYFMVNERREVVAPTGPTGPVAKVELPHTPHPVETVAPASNVAVIKATQAIESCASLEALEIIKNQIELSVKLDKADKPALRGMIINRTNEINADAFIKRNG